VSPSSDAAVNPDPEGRPVCSVCSTLRKLRILPERGAVTSKCEQRDMSERGGRYSSLTLEVLK